MTRASKERIEDLHGLADNLTNLGLPERGRQIHEAARDLANAQGEIDCIVWLLKHPKRNKANIIDWLNDVKDLGWVK